MRDFIRDGKLIMISDWVTHNKWQIGFTANAPSEVSKIKQTNLQQKLF